MRVFPPSERKDKDILRQARIRESLGLIKNIYMM
jgi:hypothetical protein